MEDRGGYTFCSIPVVNYIEMLKYGQEYCFGEENGFRSDRTKRRQYMILVLYLVTYLLKGKLMDASVSLKVWIGVGDLRYGRCCDVCSIKFRDGSG